MSDAREEARLRGELSAAPDHPASLLALGRFLTAHSHDREAASLFRHALRIDCSDVNARFLLGELLHSYEESREEAVALLKGVLAADPGRIVAYRLLAWSLLRQGNRAEAIAVLREWLNHAPGDTTGRHLLAAYAHEMVPARAPDEFVRKTFDDSADFFDVLLRDTLHYCAPEVLLAALQNRLPQTVTSICDFGCGTGLCAPLLRPLTTSLVGVDLSGRMLEKARALALYDALSVAEGTAFLHANRDAYDLIFAADTLEYFGALGELLTAAFSALRNAGVVAFTVEKQPNESTSAFELSDTGRYRHSAAYVMAQLSGAGFIDVDLTEATVRIEAGQAVVAIVAIAQKPPRAV